MYQGVFLLKDPCDSHSLLGNLHLVLAPAEAFRKKGISDFELTTFKRKDIKQSMKPPFSSMGEWDGSERRLPETTVLTILSAGWCKYQKNGKTFRLYLRECTNRPSCMFTGSGSCLIVRQILLEQAAPVTRVLVSSAEMWSWLRLLSLLSQSGGNNRVL